MHKMRIQCCLGGKIDHRADVSGEIDGIAHIENIHRAFEARDQAVGGFFRQEENSQCRTALACRAEGRRDDIVDHLLSLSRGVHK